MSAKNINSGIDSLRNQAGEPCFFVNWQDADGKHSEFFPNMKRAWQNLAYRWMIVSEIHLLPLKNKQL